MTGKRTLKQDHFTIHTDNVRIEKTQDYWVIADAVITREGVFNRGLRLKEDLERTWMLWNNVPFTHLHPDEFEEMGVVIDMRRVGGWTDNVRFRDEDGAVVTDIYLARRAQDGFGVTEAMVSENKLLVAGVRNGEKIHLSGGYFSTDEFADGVHDGRPYDHIRREFIPNHVARVPIGACGWEDGCGLGRAQPGADHSPPPPGAGRQKKTEENENMTKPKADCPSGDGSPPDENPEGGQNAAQRSDDKVLVSHQELQELRSFKSEFKDFKEELKKDREQRVKADKVRLDQKRGELADLLLPPNADEEARTAQLDKLADVPETALDSWIEREKEFRGRLDNVSIGGPGLGADAKEIEGVTQHARGWTVTDWGKVPSGSSEPFPGYKPPQTKAPGVN